MTMKKIEDLSAEMISKIPKVKELALEGISDGKRYQNFSSVNAFKCIEWNYKKCGYRIPVIMVTENPLEMQMMFNFVKSIDGDTRFSNFESFYPQLFKQFASQELTQFHTPLGVRLRSMQRSGLGSRASSNLDSDFLHKLENQLHAQLYSKLFSELECLLVPELSSELGFSLRSDLRLMLGDQLGQGLDDQIDWALSKQRTGLGDKHLSYLFTTSFYSDYIYAWYEFLRSELQLIINQDFQECFSLQKTSGICQAIYSEELCVISKYPKCIYWNDEHQLHNEFSSAIEWGHYSEMTRLECSFINGVAVPMKDYSSIMKTDLITHSKKASWGNYTPFSRIA